jgi:small subunit ribosomal protein S14|mmetsp:Transcript_15806/g.32418  ORF Transcript_15806/g.32418 Transcript_15806/m.32418 type:complete len:100 (-) Transcript_15806:668-967(-)
MKHLILKERLVRQTFSDIETQYIALKTIISNQTLSSFIRFEACLLLTKVLKKKSRFSFKNRCFLTGRGRGYSRFFNLSRIQTRNLARNNDLPSIKKASW